VTCGGTAGGGALFNSGNDFYNQTLNITLTGHTTFGGSHRWDLTSGSSLSGPFGVKLKFTGGYAEWDTVSLAANVRDLEIVQGAFGIKGMGSSFGNMTNTLTVRPTAELDFWNSASGGGPSATSSISTSRSGLPPTGPSGRAPSMAMIWSASAGGFFGSTPKLSPAT